MKLQKSSKPKLKRTVGLFSLVLYGIGDILGSGIYGLVGKAAGEMGAAVWLSFFLSMIAAGLTALSYASIASRYPRAGGAAYVTYRAFNSGFVSYVIGLMILASGLTSMATAARIFAGYFTMLIPLPVNIVAIGFSLLVAFVVFQGISESLFANSIFTFIEVSGLLLILVIGLPYLGNVNYLDTTSIANPSGTLSFSIVLSGALLPFYSFVGFEDMLNIAEEVENPRSTMPKAMILAIGFSSLIYMGVSLVAVSVISPKDLFQSQQPLVDVVVKAAPWFPISLFSAIAMFAVANTALLNFIMGSRLLYGMSKQGLVPKVLTKIHSTKQTPHASVALVWLLFVILVLSGNISSLAKATSVLLLSCFVVVNIALIVLKKKERIAGSLEIPYFVPATGALVCLAMLIKAQLNEVLTALIVFTLIAILYLIMRPKPEAIAAMEELT